MKDPIWKRSSFGSMLWVAGVMLIGWLVSDRTPTEQDWMELLGLVLMVFGYNQFRPTGPVKPDGLPRSDQP